MMHIIPIKQRHFTQLAEVQNKIKELEAVRGLILDVYIAASEFDGKDFKVVKIDGTGIQIHIEEKKELGDPIELKE